jgi:hypothetical protein
MTIVGSQGDIEVALLVLETLSQRRFLCLQRRVLGECHSQWGVGGDSPRHRASLFERGSVRDHFGDESGGLGPSGGPEVPSEQHRRRLGLADGANQPLGAARAGNDSQLDLGYTEFRRFGGDDDVAGQRQFAASAEREALDGGDDRLGEPDELLPKRPAGPVARPKQRLVAQCVETGDIRARAERSVRTGHHDGTNVVIFAQPDQLAPHLLQQLDTQAVVRGWAVQFEDRDGAVASGPQDS